MSSSDPPDDRPADADTLRRKALQRMRPGGKPVSELSEQGPRALVHELEVHQVELEVQNEELRRAQAELIEARDRYRDLYENAPVAYLTLDPRGVVQEANRTAARLCGRDRAELTGRRLEALLAPEHRDACYLHLRNAAAKQDGHTHEFCLRRPDDTPAWVLLEMVALPDGDEDACGGFRVTMTDITERKAAQEGLRRQEDRLRLALESGRVGLWERDLQTNEAFWSGTLYDLLGRDRQTPVTGETFLECIHPEDRPRVRAHVAEWLGSGGVFQDEFRVVREGGQIRWLVAAGQVYPDAEGQPACIAGVNYDVTERRRAEERLRRQRELLERVFDNIPVLLVQWDPQMERFTLNRHAREVLGWTDDDANAGDFMAKVYPDPAYRREVAAFMETLSTDWREWTCTTKDGRRAPIDWANVRLTDNTRIGIGVDLRQRKAVAEALRRSREDLARAQEVGQIGSWRLDLGNNVLTWSEQAHRIFGVPKGTPLCYEDFLERVHPEDRAKVDQAWQEAVVSQPYDIEHRILVDGNVKWVRERAYLESDAAGELVAGFGITQDITDRKEAEEALRHAHAELEQRVAERTEELEETVQRLQTEAARRELAESVLRERTEKLERVSADRERRMRQLQALAGQLSMAEERERQRVAEILHDDLQQVLVGLRFQLDLLGHRLGRQAADRKAFDGLGALVQQAIAKSRTLSHDLSPAVLREQGLVPALRWLVGQMRSQHGMEVELAAPGRVEPGNEAVRSLLYRAANELLFNVVKHAGQREARVELTRQGATIRLTVRDEGKGFDPDAVLADDTRDGFGLFTIRERADLLAGRLEIHSAPGDGSTFVLTVPDEPAGQGQPAEAEAVPTMTERSQKDRPREPRGDGAIRVLLADDHRVVRQGLSLLLSEEEGMEVVGQADNGKHAVDLVGALQPDVVIMDVSMPVMSGVEATRIIRREWPDVRVIALSMYDREDLARDMLDAGAEAYLAKTGRSEKLLAAIRGEPVE